MGLVEFLLSSGNIVLLFSIILIVAILALNSVPDPENYSTYFLRIDNVRFKNKVVPGDTLQFELKLTEPIRRGIVVMEAKAYVGGRLTTEASLMAQVAKNKA